MWSIIKLKGLNVAADILYLEFSGLLLIIASITALGTKKGTVKCR